MTSKSQPTKEAKITEVANELTKEQLDKVSAGKSGEFVKIDGIKGESTEKSLEDPIRPLLRFWTGA